MRGEKEEEECRKEIKLQGKGAERQELRKKSQGRGTNERKQEKSGENET